MSFTSRRDLHVVATAKAVSFFGDAVATVALLLHLQPSGAGAVAGLLVANLAPLALLSGVAGRLVDRYDSRRLLVVSGATQALVCVALTLVVGSAPVGVVFALVALLGAGQSVNGATWQALVPALVPPASLARALGVVQGATTLAGVAAPAIAGVLVGGSGTRLPLLVDAATFVTVTLAALLVRTRRAPARTSGRLRGAAPIVWQHPVLRPAFLLLGLFVLLGAMVNVVEVFLVRETLHASATWFGAVGAVQAAGLLVGVTAAGRLLAASLAQARALAGSAVALALALVLIGVSPDITWLLVACLLGGTANGVLNVATNALVLGAAAPSERGRVGALFTGVASGTQLAATALGGLLAGVLDPRTVYVLGGVLGLLAPALLGRRLVAASRSSASVAAATGGPPVTPAPAAPRPAPVCGAVAGGHAAA